MILDTDNPKEITINSSNLTLDRKDIIIDYLIRMRKARLDNYSKNIINREGSYNCYKEWFKTGTDARIALNNHCKVNGGCSECAYLTSHIIIQDKKTNKVGW